MNVLVILPGFIPSTIIGILRPLAELEKLGEINLRLRLGNFSHWIKSDAIWCDVAVFCRNCELKDLNFLYELKKNKKKIVYELDDNFEEIPLTTDIGIYHRQFYRLHVVKRFFSLSDVTRVYSERLKSRALLYGAKIQIIKSYFDINIIDKLQREPKDIPCGKVKIVYPTGRIDDKELEYILFSSIKSVLVRYENEVEFHLWRNSMPQQLEGMKNVVLNHPLRNYEEFIRQFYLSNYDIGLAPGIDNVFFHSKTNNKYREFGGCHIAGVYSNFPPYSNTVIHNETGLLSDNNIDAWVSSIERLICDKKLRERIADQAFYDVSTNYTFDEAVRSWRDCFLRLKEQNEELLFANEREWYDNFNASNKSLFYLFNTGNVSLKDKRFSYIETSVRCINSYIYTVLLPIEYIAVSANRKNSASIFILNNSKDFTIILSVARISRSIILDVSKFNANQMEDLYIFLREVIGLVPISLLVSNKQVGSICPSIINGLHSLSIVSELDSSSLVQYFSLNGYPAAYLDLLERHSCFSDLKEDGKFVFLTKKISRFKNIFGLYKSRITTLYTLIKWRFGNRLV
ncbi:hypothetical protein LZT24_17715 [Aeromonas veronii]|uniref:glycosyltransferase n=1 Tax=Aeromonas veronii TaxID=654 RepID=UPI0021E91C62|nr:hypothetical protein [Aeromonas veronii]MCV3285901.1 hypothetical protein [Aeromonas veronii]